MSKKNEIRSILPKISDIVPDILREKTPREIMKEYEEAINESYPGYCTSFVTETSRLDQGQGILSYSFYLVAFIGKGYNYKLFEVVPTRIDRPYPVELILYENHPSNTGELSSETRFYNKLYDYFQSGFFKNVIGNLSAQVDLYRESRNETD